MSTVSAAASRKNVFNVRAWLAIFLCAGMNSAQAKFQFGLLQGQVQIQEKLVGFVALKAVGGYETKQLHPSCLSAKILNQSENATFSEVGQAAKVRFEPTIENGGLLRIESEQPIRSPLSTLTVYSNCPLAEFKHTWSLFADPAKPNENVPALSLTTRKGEKTFELERTPFEFEQSSILNSTREVPQEWVRVTKIARQIRSNENQRTQLAQSVGQRGSQQVDAPKTNDSPAKLPQKEPNKPNLEPASVASNESGSIPSSHSNPQVSAELKTGEPQAQPSQQELAQLDTTNTESSNTVSEVIEQGALHESENLQNEQLAGLLPTRQNDAFGDLKPPSPTNKISQGNLAIQQQHVDSIFNNTALLVTLLAGFLLLSVLCVLMCRNLLTGRGLLSMPLSSRRQSDEAMYPSSPNSLRLTSSTSNERNIEVAEVKEDDLDDEWSPGLKTQGESDQKKKPVDHHATTDLKDTPLPVAQGEIRSGVQAGQENITEPLVENHSEEDSARLTDSVCELIEGFNETNLKPWSLSQKYQKTAEQKADLLTHGQWINMQRIRLQLSLIELAYMKAQTKAPVLNSEYEFLLGYFDLDHRLIDSDHGKPATQNSALTVPSPNITNIVPDIIRSQVESKVIEQPDSDLLNNFFSALKSLSSLKGSGLCFNKPAWGELLSNLT